MKLNTTLLNIFFSFSLLWLCFVAAWQVLGWQDFHYAYWYKQLSIQEHIQQYAPKNRFGKQNFSLTLPVQHKEKFSEVVSSINNGGKGLASIYYQLPDSAERYPLFTQAEVIHLQDVANLIDVMTYISMAILFLFVLTVITLANKKITLFSMVRHILYGLLLIVFFVLLIFLLGAKNVFYWLHIKIFPDDHQWFFFYEESLMATFMKAPVLFGPIAATWLLVALMLWLLFFYVITALLKRFYYH